MRLCTSIAPLLVVAALAGCTRTIRTGPLIDHYSRAECIPTRFGPGISPPTRTWDYTLKTREGVAVHVSGAQMPGGRIDVKYMPNGKEAVAANAGDYIYPSEVRFDRTNENLYIKADGVPAGLSESETWLFAYDLRKQNQSGRAKVDPSVLPHECQ